MFLFVKSLFESFSNIFFTLISYLIFKNEHLVFKNGDDFSNNTRIYYF